MAHVANNDPRELYSRLLQSGELVDGHILGHGETAPLEYILSEPVLYITTEGGAPIVDKVNYVNCTYKIVNQQGFGQTLFEQTGRIRGRGNSTWTMPKKPWKVKLDASVPVLGMPKSKDWALLANYIDPSRMRNCLATELSNRIGLPWAPRIVNVEVYLNGQYQGLYMWTETVEVDNDRVDIDEIKDSNTSGNKLTGGYIMEIDTRLEQDDEIGWRTRLNVPFIFDTPDGDITEQYDYMQSFTQGCEDALFSEDFLDGEWRDVWFDMDSWAEWYLVNELIANNDSGFGSSVKLTKPRDPTSGPPSKLYLGPIWDQDASCGITFFIPHPSYGWWTRVGATWIARMLEDPVFADVVKKRWAYLRSRLLAEGDTIHDWIADYQASIAGAVTRDKQLWGNGSAPDVNTWLAARIEWIESQLISGVGDTAPPSTPTGFVASDVQATSISFSWDDAGINQGTGVVGYRIRQSGVIVAITAYPYSPTINEVDVTGLSSGTQYSFTLEARDPAGNWSVATAPLVVTTAAA